MCIRDSENGAPTRLFSSIADYAQGEPIGIQPYDPEGSTRERVQLRRPLDYAVVTDHSDLLGETRICGDPSLSGHESLVCRVVRRKALAPPGPRVA